MILIRMDDLACFPHWFSPLMVPCPPANAVRSTASPFSGRGADEPAMAAVREIEAETRSQAESGAGSGHGTAAHSRHRSRCAGRYPSGVHPCSTPQLRLNEVSIGTYSNKPPARQPQRLPRHRRGLPRQRLGVGFAGHRPDERAAAKRIPGPAAEIRRSSRPFGRSRGCPRCPSSPWGTPPCRRRRSRRARRRQVSPSSGPRPGR